MAWMPPFASLPSVQSDVSRFRRFILRFPKRTEVAEVAEVAKVAKVAEVAEVASDFHGTGV